MKKNCLVIGITGFAMTGKNLAADLIKSEFDKLNLKTTNYAFADQLKYELTPFIKKNFEVDIRETNGIQKSLFRPLMVDYGLLRRKMSQNRYWIECLNKKIQKDSFSDIITISDLRYIESKNDEFYYIKKELGGIVLYIDKCKIIKGKKYWTKPPNEAEKVNIPILENKSNCAIYWKDCGGNIDKINKKCLPHIQKFVNFLKTMINIE